jgi:hypothetical protein
MIDEKVIPILNLWHEIIGDVSLDRHITVGKVVLGNDRTKISR